METQGIIFDIERFAIHDGPGIRTTVFFKGCPLSCWWCHNPESQSPLQEIMVRPTRCLEGCDECVAVCDVHAVSRNDEVSIRREKCNMCGECGRICPTEALQIVGRRVTVGEVMTEIEKDSVFYDESEGGVTFSGGEPLMQPEFLSSLLAACKKRGIRTALDTSGYAPFKILEGLIDNVDLFVYDVKLVNDELHKKYTGVSNMLILENLQKLAKLHKNMETRIPLIPGITDSEENAGQIVQFLSSLNGIEKVALLPYHASGKKKYEGLDKENKMAGITPPPQERVEKIKSKFEEYGFEVKIGG